jgi:tRNA threonylcarbamoyladenosine biosynthesis protein TsaE
MIYTTVKPEETQKIALEFAEDLLNLDAKGAKVVALEGELGAGKTVFVQGLAKSLGVIGNIKSPTFVLMKNYGLSDERTLYHLDCYRLRDEHDLVPLDIGEILSDAKNIVLIEWSERVAKILPQRYYRIHIDHIDEQTRKIEIEKIG